jgi:hypothetical protein
MCVQFDIGDCNRVLIVSEVSVGAWVRRFSLESPKKRFSLDVLHKILEITLGGQSILNNCILIT